MAAMPDGLQARIPALDGVRGMAILLVIAFHARVVFASRLEMPLPVFRVLGLGWSGVDLFFALSGFLITGILLDSRKSPHYFRAFYLRRALRIFPLYFAYLFLILVVSRYGWLLISGSDLWSSTDSRWYFSYLLNWKTDHGYNDLYLGHLWSLAIEEQFYVVWPAVVFLVPRRQLKWVCLAVVAGAPVARIYLAAHGFDSEAIYRMTPCRMDVLAMGAFVAIGLRDFRETLARWKPRVLVAAACGIFAIFATTSGPVWSDAPMRVAGASLIGLLYAGLVHSAATTDGGILRTICCKPFLRQCGKYSYAMYVLHSMPYHLTAPWVRSLSSPQTPFALVLAAKYLYGPALAVTALAAAWLSWRILEQPFVRWKDRVPYFVPAQVTAAIAAPGQCIPFRGELSAAISREA